MDQSLFTDIVQRRKDDVFRLAYSYMGSPSDADDITQTVFLKLYQSKTTFESDAHIKNWLLKVTANECRSLLRSWWRKREDIEAYAETLSFTPRQTQLLEVVMQMPEKYRIPLYLHYYEDYTAEEIGEILHLPAATVRTQLLRGRKRLRILLGEA